MTTTLVTVDGPMVAVSHLAEALCEDAAFPADAAGAFDQGDGSWRLEAYFTDRPDRPRLALRLESLLADHGASPSERARILASLRLRVLSSQDYAATGLDALPPIVAGRFRVFGDHNQPARLRRADLRIEASTAFGSGDHASTALSLTHLHSHLRRCRPARVLDVGTGTGILGIALKKAVPEAAVLASDIDLHAVRIARGNARRNAIAAGFHAIAAAGLTRHGFQMAAPFDLVLANILPDPLVAMAGDIARLTAPGGTLIIAGLRLGERKRLVSAYRARGFLLRRTLSAKEWASLMFQRAGQARF